jgi:hypothetical protein
MASDNTGSMPPGRRPPTIDLTATEVASGQPSPGAGQSASGSTGEARASGASGQKANTKAGAGLWFHVLDRLPSNPNWALIGAGVAGLVLIGFTALCWNGAFTPVAASRDDDARLSRIEAQLRDLASRPAPAPDAKGLGDVVARLGKIEAVLNAAGNADPALAARVGSAEGAAKVAADEIAALRGRLDEIAALARGAQSRADAAASAAEAAQKSSQTTTAELARAALADDRASRRAVAANALRTAVERGEPFAAELAAAKPLASDPSVLAPLEPFAASGVIQASALARELAGLVPALLRASSSASPDAGFFEKLQTNAEKLVRLRPVGDVGGDDPANVIARIETRAGQGDVDSALPELQKLPAAVRAPADAWIKKANDRAAAIAASRQFARDALAALGKPGL